MISYLIKRLGYGLLVLFGVVTVVFTLFTILPGDAARMTQGQRSDVATMEAVNKEFGLDKDSIDFFVANKDLSEYYEKVVSEFEEWTKYRTIEEVKRDLIVINDKLTIIKDKALLDSIKPQLELINSKILTN